MSNDEAIKNARAVLDGFFQATNEKDVNALKTRWMHFPHVRFQAGNVIIMNKPDDLLTPVISRQGHAAEWAYTKWDYQEVVDAGPEKVHFRVQFSRYRQDDSLIGAYKSFYIVTLKDGRWGIQGRSTWAQE